MRIRFQKGRERHRLECRREDGTCTQASLGTEFPYHDLAHYIVERDLSLNMAFFGMIRSGRTIAEMGQTEVIRNLSAQAMLAEVIVRNLQSLQAAASPDPQTALELIIWELNDSGGSLPESLDRTSLSHMLRKFQILCQQWNDLAEQAWLELDF